MSVWLGCYPHWQDIVKEAIVDSFSLRFWNDRLNEMVGAEDRALMFRYTCIITCIQYVYLDLPA